MSVTPYYHPERAFHVAERFPDLMQRAKAAKDAGFVLEAMTIVHSTMENYTYAVLIALGIPFKAADRMFQCLSYLQLHLEKKDIPGAAVSILQKDLVDSGLLSRIDNWRNRRNVLIHDYVIENFSEEELAAFAAKGVGLAEAYASVCDAVLKTVKEEQKGETK